MCRCLTPGITRRPEPLIEFDRQRVGGRVHAVVRCGVVERAYDAASTSRRRRPNNNFNNPSTQAARNEMTPTQIYKARRSRYRLLLWTLSTPGKAQLYGSYCERWRNNPNERSHPAMATSSAIVRTEDFFIANPQVTD